MYKVCIEDTSGIKRWVIATSVEHLGYKIIINTDDEILHYLRDSKTGVLKSKYGIELHKITIDSLIVYDADNEE